MAITCVLLCTDLYNSYMMKRDQNFWKVGYFMQKYQLLIHHHCSLHSLLLVKEKQKHTIMSIYFHVVIFVMNSSSFFIYKCSLGIYIYIYIYIYREREREREREKREREREEREREITCFSVKIVTFTSFTAVFYTFHSSH